MIELPTSLDFHNITPKHPFKNTSNMSRSELMRVLVRLISQFIGVYYVWSYDSCYFTEMLAGLTRVRSARDVFAVRRKSFHEDAEPSVPRRLRGRGVNWPPVTDVQAVHVRADHVQCNQHRHCHSPHADERCYIQMRNKTNSQDILNMYAVVIYPISMMCHNQMTDISHDEIKKTPKQLNNKIK